MASPGNLWEIQTIHANSQAPSKTYWLRTSDVGVCVGGNHLSPHDPPGGPDYAPISESLVSVQFSLVQSLSRVWLFATPWIAAPQASLPITNSRNLLKPMSLESAMTSAISSSVVPFSSCPQSLPASGSFPISQLFPWGGQSVGVSASASVLPMSHWFTAWVFQEEGSRVNRQLCHILVVCFE